MLDLAIKYKRELQEKYLRLSSNYDRYKYLIATNWINYELKIDNNDWDKLQYVSVNSQNEVIGFFECKINRIVYYAYDLIAISFEEKPNFIFSKDLKEFIIDIIFMKHKFNKLRFTCVVGNPIEKSYDRLILKYGGRIVGVYEKEVRLVDNSICDLKLYEITRDAVISRLNKK